MGLVLIRGFHGIDSGEWKNLGKDYLDSHREDE